MSAGVTDDWSGLGAGQPSWTFGDGGTGAGASVSHAFAAPGTFTVTIGAQDALGNAAAAVTRQIVVSNAKGAPPPPPPGSGAPTTIASAKLKATWKASHLVGSVSVSGTVGANTTLTLSIRRHGGKKTVAKSTFKAKAGKWTHSVTLPPVACAGPLRRVRHRQRGQDLAEVVHDRRAEDGHRQAQLRDGSTAWTRRPRRSAARASCGLTSSSGRCRRRARRSRPSGSSRTAASSRPTPRPRTTLVEAQVKDLSGKPLPTGRWRCVISAGGVVVATLSVRLK